MSVESPSVFTQVIQDHLELKRRNSELDTDLPLARYKAEDPFDNHPLFKTEEQARLEETMDGVEPDQEKPQHHRGAWFRRTFGLGSSEEDGYSESESG